MKTSYIALLALSVTFGLAGCGGGGSSGPSPKPTNTPIPTSTPVSVNVIGDTPLPATPTLELTRVKSADSNYRDFDFLPAASISKTSISLTGGSCQLELSESSGFKAGDTFDLPIVSASQSASLTLTNPTFQLNTATWGGSKKILGQIEVTSVTSRTITLKLKNVILDAGSIIRSPGSDIPVSTELPRGTVTVNGTIVVTVD